MRWIFRHDEKFTNRNIPLGFLYITLVLHSGPCRCSFSDTPAGHLGQVSIRLQIQQRKREKEKKGDRTLGKRKNTHYSYQEAMSGPEYRIHEQREWMNEESHECTCSSVPNLVPVLPNLGPVLQLRPIWDNVCEGKSAGVDPFLPRGERRVLEDWRGEAGRAGAWGRG